MNIQRTPGIPELPGRLPRLPVAAPAHDRHQHHEDAYRGTARLVGSLLSRHSRALGHAADATGSLSLTNTALQTTLGAASLALGVVDGMQSYQAYKAGDRVMGHLNCLGSAANLIGGGLGLAQVASSSPLLADLGTVAQSAGILADAAEDFVESQRLERPQLLVRGSVKSGGAALMLAGMLTSNPSLQLLGNLVSLGGIVLHYTPMLDSQPPG